MLSVLAIPQAELEAKFLDASLRRAGLQRTILELASLERTSLERTRLLVADLSPAPPGPALPVRCQPTALAAPAAHRRIHSGATRPAAPTRRDRGKRQSPDSPQNSACDR